MRRGGGGELLVGWTVPSAGMAMEYWAGPPWKVRWTVWASSWRPSRGMAEALASRPRAEAKNMVDFMMDVWTSWDVNDSIRTQLTS
jgi:hypothetical protein